MEVHSAKNRRQRYPREVMEDPKGPHTPVPQPLNLTFGGRARQDESTIPAPASDFRVISEMSHLFWGQIPKEITWAYLP